MEVPQLVVNPSHLFPDEYYQITNISDDMQSYDFMGFKGLSVKNTWAANIIRDRLDKTYYDNLDYELTSDDLDLQDMSCIAEGIVEIDHDLMSIPNDIIPTRPELRGLDWDELIRLSKGEGEKDMTKEEIDQYVMETYKLDFDSIKKDNEVVKRHEFIASELEKMNIKEEKESIEFNQKELEEIAQMPKPDEGQINSQEQKNEYIKQKEEKLIDKEVDLLEGINLEKIKNDIIKNGGDINDINNYMSFSLFFTNLLGEDEFDKNKTTIKDYVRKICMQLCIEFKNKKVYKGVLKFIALELNRRHMLNNPIFGEDIDGAAR